MYIKQLRVALQGKTGDSLKTSEVWDAICNFVINILYEYTCQSTTQANSIRLLFYLTLFYFLNFYQNK